MSAVDLLDVTPEAWAEVAADLEEILRRIRARRTTGPADDPDRQAGPVVSRISEDDLDADTPATTPVRDRPLDAVVV